MSEFPLGRLVLPALRWAPETGFRHAAPAIEQALGFGAGGFIVFGGSAGEVRDLTARLVRVAGRPLLIGADLERGAGQQFAGLTELPPPRALAALDDPSAIRAAGALTGSEARSVGVNWVFAPVADLDLEPRNPIVQTRSFGSDATRVAGAVAEWVAGCQGAGALAAVKHYPGHGRTVLDSHAELPEVSVSARVLADTDELPFAAGIGAGVAAVMTAHVAYPALDPSRLPATLSPPIIARLRGRGFDGLVVSDALIMGGVLAGRTPGELAVMALNAGVDLLLYPSDPVAASRALDAAVKSGELPEPRTREALRRYRVALERAAAPASLAGDPALGPALAGRVVAGGAAELGAVTLRPPLRLVVVDDDLGGPFAPGPADVVAEELTRAGVPLGTGGSTVVLAFAEPRGWKGRAGFGPESRARLAAVVPDAALVVLFGHERLREELPAGGPVLVAWHRQPLMQRAVAAWLAARVIGSAR